MRKGILAGGNLIMDYVKIIDCWPSEGMLANIEREGKNPGGAPHNVLVDLAKFDVDMPLFAVGLCGDDEVGEEILHIFNSNNIDTTYIQQTSLEPTSYTEVMTVKASGNRTFFHCRGANKLLCAEHFQNIETNAKIFHLGYLLLLDKLDELDSEYGVVAAKVLANMRKKGYKTSVDVVSEDSDRYQKIVVPCLKYTDYLIINEVEAGRITNVNVRSEQNKINLSNLETVAQKLLDGGVGELVVIHFPEGAIALEKNGKMQYVPSFKIETSAIKGTVGAGDAFCAGVLYGIHENLSIEKSLKIGHASAYFNLQSPTSTGCAASLKIIQEFVEQY